MVIPIILIFALSLSLRADQKISALVYDRSQPQLAFAASEIVAASKSAIPEFGPTEADGVKCSPCIVLKFGNTGAPQSFQIRRTRSASRDVITVTGADNAGTMYGGLEIAEAVRLLRTFSPRSPIPWTSCSSRAPTARPMAICRAGRLSHAN